MASSSSTEKDLSVKDETPSVPQDVEASALHKEDEPIYPAESLSTPRQILFVGILCMAMYTNQLGLGNTLGIVGVIGDSFNIHNVGQLSWLVAGYSLTIGTFILIGGRLGDEFGHKKMFVIGMAWYALWALVGGLSVYSSHVLFVFARVFQGMGPAMTLPNSMAILGNAYSPGPKKNMAFAWFGGTAPFGALSGFAFGGIFAKYSWWPWTFWTQAIALTFLAIFGAWSIPNPVPKKDVKQRTTREKLEDLDIPGQVTGVTALVLINFAWNQAVVVGWPEPYVYVCLILGFIFVAIFFYIELRVAKNPIMPLAAFNSDIAFVFACTATGWATFGIWVFYAAEIAINIRGIEPVLLAAWYSPIVPSGLISALGVGKLLGKLPASYIMLVGQVAYTVGSVLAAAMPVHASYWTYFFFSVLIICVGMDTSFPASAILFSNAVPPKYQGIGASVVLTIVNYSISLGLGFAGTLENQINNGGKTEADILYGYRGALWLAVGFAGLGLLLSLVFIAKEYRKKGSVKSTS